MVHPMTSRFTVYTDGSGLTGGPAGIAFVALREGAVPLEWSLPLPNATNHQAEMLAATHALTELPLRSVIELQSDSEYVVKNWNERLPNWRKHNPWRTSNRRPPDNQDYWERLIEAVALHEDVTFTWLPAHAGHEFNERAHQLAHAARLLAEKLYGAEDETADA
jgi:ribonuclease HI